LVLLVAMAACGGDDGKETARTDVPEPAVSPPVTRTGYLDAYWSFHLDQERRRVHESRYDSGIIPAAA